MDSSGEMTNAFWPAPDVLRGDELNEEAWADGPLSSDLVIALLPAIRALFLLGYQVATINTTETTGSGETVTWWSLDLRTLVPFEQPLPFDRPRQAFNIAFELDQLNDGDELTGDGFGMPLPAEAIGMDAALPAGSLVPDELQSSIDRFVEQAVATLAAALPASGQADRGQGSGMLWLLDPIEWEGIDADPQALMRGMLPAQAARAADFVREQVTGAQTDDPDRPPHLEWLFATAGRTADYAKFTSGIRQSIQARGVSHIVNLTRWLELFWPSPSEAPPWLDVLAELLCRGVILIEGLIDPADPPPPLEARQVSDREVQLMVWGEAPITIKRVHDSDGATGLDGSASWEYVPGDALNRPRVLVVAGRGLSIAHQHRYITSWDLELYRVQSDHVIGPPQAPIEPWRFTASDLVEAWRYQGAELPDPRWPMGQVMTQPKPDGLYLLYPVFGGDAPGASPPPDPSRQDRAFAVQLTVDPLAPDHWYAVDVHYYTFADALGTAGGMHLSVWVSKGVTAASSYAPGPVADNNPQVHWSTIPDSPSPPPPWAASAELWQVGQVEAVPAPWWAPLPVSRALLPDVEADARDVDVGGPAMPAAGESGVVHYTDPLYGIDAQLTPRRFDDLPAEGDENIPVPVALIEFILDLDVGLIPVVGEVVAVAEVIYAWQFGVDRWGRPVTNFQLAMMTLFALVPFVSGSFIEELSGAVGRAAGIRGAVGPGLFDELFVEAAPALELDETALADGLLAQPMSGPHIWALPSGQGVLGKEQLLAAMGTATAADPNLVSAYVGRVFAAGGDDLIRVADLQLTSTSGFAANVLDDSLGRYLVAHPEADRSLYVQSAALDRARAILNGVLHTEDGMRAASRRTNMPSCDGLAPIAGPGARVGPMRRAPVLDLVRQHAQAAIDDPRSMWLEAAGALRPANDTVPFRLDQLLADADAILGPDFDTLSYEAKKLLVGGDYLNGQLVSRSERAYRLTQGLLIVYREAADLGLDATQLTSTGLLGPVRDFIRMFITRGGKEWGPRFELRTSIDVVQSLAGLIEELRFQIPMPSVAGDELQSGVDLYVIFDGIAYPIQVKATRNPNPMTSGTCWFLRNGLDQMKSVRGPNATAQLVKDQIRRGWWVVDRVRWIPPQGVEALRAPANPAAAGWAPLGDTQFLVFDDVYMANVFSEAVFRATAYRGRTTVSLLRDLNVSEATAAFYARLLGTDLLHVDANLQDLFTEALHNDGVGWLEADIQRELTRPEIKGATGKPMKTKVLLSTNLRLELQNFFQGMR